MVNAYQGISINFVLGVALSIAIFLTLMLFWRLSKQVKRYAQLEWDLAEEKQRAERYLSLLKDEFKNELRNNKELIIKKEISPFLEIYFIADEIFPDHVYFHITNQTLTDFEVQRIYSEPDNISFSVRPFPHLLQTNGTLKIKMVLPDKMENFKIFIDCLNRDAEQKNIFAYFIVTEDIESLKKEGVGSIIQMAPRYSLSSSLNLEKTC